jgi:hypothetical protein
MRAPEWIRQDPVTSVMAALTSSAAIGAALSLLGADVIRAFEPYDALPASLSSVWELWTHNAPVVLWPLALIALAWPWSPGLHRLGDVLVAGTVLGHGITIGSALAQQPELWRYLPHLPLEWLAIALPAAAWRTARKRPAPGPIRALLPTAAATAGLLLLAAIVETYAVPL